MSNLRIVKAARRSARIRAWPTQLVLAAAVFCAAAPVAAQEGPELARCGQRIPSSEARGFVGLPTGQVFCPLIADPKATRSFLSYQSTINDDELVSSIGAVGIGDEFGIMRWGGSTLGNGVQLSLQGAVFAQFDLDTPSYDLLNADYIVGVPLTMRRGAFAARFRIYHQSSHLGDEFLLRPQDSVRVNLSFESLEGILSVDVGALRLYGGGEYLINRSPDDLEHQVAHAGAELRPLTRIMALGPGQVRPIAAVDLKSSQEQDWKPSVSVRAGLEFDRRGRNDPPPRRWSVLFESYTGPSPYGQFFREEIRYIGIGLHFQP
jgi:hypothetical protein